MSDDLDQCPIQRQWEQQQQVWAATAATVAVGVAGAGVSLYGQSVAAQGAKQAAAGQQQAANAEIAAAASNAYVEKMTATAQAQSAIYADELSYKTAMLQSQQSYNNVNILTNAAKRTTEEGQAQIQVLNQQDEQANSTARAAFGASGVTEDSGAPALVQAHNAGIQQIGRMDAQYKFNNQASDLEWQGELQKYQGDLTAATAQQYKYAEAMAQWQQQASIAGADIQQGNANNTANAQIAASNAQLTAASAAQISGYASALSQVGGSVNSGISTYKGIKS